MGAHHTATQDVSFGFTPPSSRIVAISMGNTFACALTSASAVGCWGWAVGVVGWEQQTVSEFVGVANLSDSVTALGKGSTSAHMCAITLNGGLKCWGWNSKGQLGDGSTTDTDVPVDVAGLSSGVVSVSEGNSHTCAVTSTGAVKCWGNNWSGQLGNGSTTDSLVPVDVVGLSTGVVAVAAGENFTCALTAAGAVKCWGLNEQGQLGNASTTSSDLPVNTTGLSSGVLAIFSGGEHTCALGSGGVLKCWGFNLYGQLGNGSTTNGLVPADVLGLPNGVVNVAASVDHTCAVTSASTVACWGSNVYGQLGDGTTTDSFVPVNVQGL